MGETEQDVGAKSYVCKGNVQCVWHSDVEETAHGCQMCLAMVPMYYISLPAEISLSLCFMNIICLFKLQRCFFFFSLFFLLFFPSPSHALTLAGKPDLSGLVGSEQIYL